MPYLNASDTFNGRKGLAVARSCLAGRHTFGLEENNIFLAVKKKKPTKNFNKTHVNTCPSYAEKATRSRSLNTLSRSHCNLSSLSQQSLTTTPALQASTKLRQSTGVFWCKHMAPAALKMTER